MANIRNVTVSEAMWRRFKQRALDEGVTLREVVERAGHQYLGGAALQAPAQVRDRIIHAIAEQYPAPHWTKDDDPA